MAGVNWAVPLLVVEDEDGASWRFSAADMASGGGRGAREVFGTMAMKEESSSLNIKIFLPSRGCSEGDYSLHEARSLHAET